MLRYHETNLKRIFAFYAQADQRTADALDSLDTVNLPELIFMMKEGNLIDEHLTLACLNTIFMKVNASFQETGENDDEQELDFDEFKDVLARACHAKIPEAKRAGTPFELTLHSWLQLIFVPTYNKKIKQAARGIGHRTM